MNLVGDQFVELMEQCARTEQWSTRHFYWRFVTKRNCAICPTLVHVSMCVMFMLCFSVLNEQILESMEKIKQMITLKSCVCTGFSK